MTNSNNGDRLDRIEALVESFIAASIADRQASNERMAQLDQRLEQSMKSSDERMTRLEQSQAASDERLTRIEQIVESNNRFLESFSADLRSYADSMNNMATRMDGIIATNNQDRQETNTRLSAIQQQVAAIARHLGVI